MIFSEQLFIGLEWKTPEHWVFRALESFDEFLQDHASAERKAHASCLMIATRYPHMREIMEFGLSMAAEELQHFREVVSLIHARGGDFEPSRPDPYIEGLLEQLRGGSKESWLMDRLLMSTIIEARGCERFGMMGEALRTLNPRDFAGGLPEAPEPFRSELGPSLADYYTELSRTEARHYGTYIRLAKAYFPADAVEARLREMLVSEAEVLSTLPLRPSLH